MLALPVFLLSRILPAVWEPRLWALLGVSFFVWLAMQMRTYGIGLFFRILFFIAAITLAQPLQAWLWQNNTQSTENQSAVQNSLEFQQVHSYDELQQALAQNPKSMAMLDLYADWCIACKEFDHKTFADSKVQAALKDVLLLRIDMTNNSENNRTLMKQLSVTGLPTLIFFNAEGKEIAAQRISGFMESETFLQNLQAAKNSDY